jgi:hypothetical protein
MSPGHTQTRLSFEGEVTEVDAGIADLLQEIWAVLGMCTLFSCEDIDDMVWIEFLSGEQAAAFVSILVQKLEDAADSPRDSLRNRVTGRYQPSHNPDAATERWWQWSARIWDITEELLEEVALLHPEGAPKVTERAYKLGILMLVAVRFPITDYDEVLRSLRQHNGHSPVSERISP